MNKTQNSRKALSLASLAGLAAVALTIALPAQAVDFKVSGQVSRALTAVDNGQKSDVGFVDNAGSSSRFRFVGDQDLGNGNTIGLTYEIGLTDNVSYDWDVKQNEEQAGASNSYVENRLANIWVQGDWGRVEFGKVWGPGKDTMSTDYSGTNGLGGGTDIQDYAANLAFMHKHSQGKDYNGKDVYESPFRVNYGAVIDINGIEYPVEMAVFTEMDGIGRQNGINYYTPNFNGFSVGVGVFDGHAFEISPRYETEFGDGGKFGISASYTDTKDLGKNYGADGRKQPIEARFKEYGGSVGVLLPSGFNATVGYKKLSLDDNLNHNFRYTGKATARNIFGSVGYKFGQHSVATSYMQSDNVSALDGLDPEDYKSRFKAYGLAYVYNMNDSIDLFASYHLYQLKMKGQGGLEDMKFQNIHQLYSGVVVRFL